MAEIKPKTALQMADEMIAQVSARLPVASDTCPDCEFESSVHASHEHDWEGRAIEAESALAASQKELAQAKKEAEDNLTLPLTADYMRTKEALAASQAEVAALKACTCEKCVSERMAMTKKKMTKQDREIEKLQQWKRTVENAFTAGILGMEHGSLMGGTKLTAHGFITSLRVAMRQAEDEFMGRLK